MPNKLLLKLALNPAHNHVALQREGDTSPQQLHYVRAIKVEADAEADNQRVELTIYTNNFEAELEISDATAEAILRAEARRELAFIEAKHEHELRKLYAALGGELASAVGSLQWGQERNGIEALGMIINELDRRAVKG